MSAGRGKSLLYDPKLRSIFFQALFGVALIWLLYTGFTNLFENYYGKFTSDKTFGGIMDSPAGIAILTTFGTWLFEYSSTDSSNWTAFMVGIANTLIVAFIGIIIATVWGFLLGVFRLSKNFVLRSFATVYIETLRNLPLLLQIFFWIIIFRLFSGGLKEKDAVVFVDGALYYNADGLRAPFFDWLEGGHIVFWALIVAIFSAFAISRWARERQASTGQQFPAFWVGLLTLIAVPTIAFFIAGKPLSIEYPTVITEGSILKRGAFESGHGMFVATEMIALTLALAMYTAAFIAEIVRAGINSVANGQSEAAGALGISNSVALRKVILPQAMRVVIPPLTSQYLNLTKNSSLAAAIGFPEVVALFGGTILNQTGRAVEIIMLVIMVYLTISLLTSAFMNWFNNRMKLEER